MYCGDEVGAIVGDIGSNTSRFGSSGWDTPKNIFSTSVAVNNNTKHSYVVDGSKLRIVQEDLEISQPLSLDNLDWSATEMIIRYGIENVLHGTASSADIPLLLAENYFSTPERKEKLFEILFESIGLPASYLCHNGALSSFCYGRPTSLIIDFGASQTRVVPIVDGFALHRSTMTTTRGGDSIDQLLLKLIQETNGSSSSTSSTSINSRKRPRNEEIQSDFVIKPWFLTSQKHSTSSTSTSTSTFTQSFLQFHTLSIVRDIKHWMSFFPVESVDSENVSTLISQIPAYELPDKTLIHPSKQLCLCAHRTFFDSPSSSVATSTTSATSSSSSTSSSNPTSSSRAATAVASAATAAARQRREINSQNDDSNTLPLIIWNTILKSDVDIRRELLNNIIPVGGGALIDGLSPRLVNELTTLVPASMKVKVVNNQLSVEKQHAAWIGGSILSICGSFQQLWISRQEYEEHGPKVYLRKGYH